MRIDFSKLPPLSNHSNDISTGFCIGGIYSVAMAYSSEIQPIAKRSLNMLILFLFGTLGKHDKNGDLFIANQSPDQLWNILL